MVKEETIVKLQMRMAHVCNWIINYVKITLDILIPESIIRNQDQDKWTVEKLGWTSTIA